MSKQIKNQKVKTEVKNNFDITQLELWEDLILVRALRPSGVGGLINPENYEDKPEWGEIIRVGEGVKNPKAKIGLVVRFGKYSTESVRSNGNDYFLVHVEDVSGNLPEYLTRGQITRIKE